MGGSWKRGRCSGQAQGDEVNALKMENLQFVVRVRRGGQVFEGCTHPFLKKIVLKCQSGVFVHFLVSKDNPLLISTLL